MNPSHRATGHAAVRSTPASGAAAASWSLDELAVPAARDVVAAKPVPMSQATADERARLIDDGFARGLADGEKKGLASAQQRVTTALAVIDQITTQMREVASLSPAILEENIAALAVIVARQIVAREVALDRDLVADLVRRALTEFPIEQSVRIRVHPLDLAALTVIPGAEPAVPITAGRDASWLADPRVARGGCLVEGRDRIVDGRVDTALERAYQRMAQIDAA
jgi:flagellar biosynthesis/type III secretory pathway protein FliH